MGVAWVIASGLALLVPEFVHGRILGPFDLLSFVGLTKQPGVAIQSLQYGDLIDSLIPWKTMVWQQVHQGHLPLWNPYAGLGMPLAFNWQSGPLSLSSLVGYLVPLRYTFTAGVVADLLAAGTGAYFLGRVLKMGVVASAAVGTVFQLSGPIAAWLGFPFPSVMCWGGWMFAFGILLVRGRHRAGCLVGLAVSISFALYGGAPEGFVVLLLTVAVFFAYVLLCRARWMGGSGPILRPALFLFAAAAAGIALAAPFALPSFQLSRASVRSLSSNGGALSVHTMLYLAFQAFDGLPLVRNGHIVAFGYSAFYTETALYVGVSALVLAGMAVFVKRRSREVQGFAVVTLVCMVLVFAGSVSQLTGHLPLLGEVNLVRSAMPMALAIAVLGGYGIDAVVTAGRARDAARWLTAGFGVAAVSLGLLWLLGRRDLNPVQTSVRSHSFIWPAVEIVAGLAAAAFLFWVDRRPRRSSAMTSTFRWCVDCRGSFSSIRVWLPACCSWALKRRSSSVRVRRWSSRAPRRFLRQRRHIRFETKWGPPLSGSVVRFARSDSFRTSTASTRCTKLSVYDPIMPKEYFSAWLAATGTGGGNPGLNSFCPAVTSADEARRFGISYVLRKARCARSHRRDLRSAGRRRGLVPDPGSGRGDAGAAGVGLVPGRPDGRTPVPVQHPGPSEWRLTTSSGAPQALRLHLSNVPGWSATMDGRPLHLAPYAGMMLQARVPAGAHTIVLRYWPKTFTVGIVLAAGSAAFLAGLLVLAGWRRRSTAAATPGGERPRCAVGTVPAGTCVSRRPTGHRRAVLRRRGTARRRCLRRARRRWSRSAPLRQRRIDGRDRAHPPVPGRELDRVEVLDLPRNVGKAEAVRLGLRQALDGDASIVGYLDADLATPGAGLLELVRILQQRDDLSAVFGSRMARLGSHIERSAFRHYTGRVYATLASWALGVAVYDTQCGAKVFRVGPTLAAALEEPFRSAWSFDVLLCQRLFDGTRGVPGLPARTFLEVPLDAWSDVGGSKVHVSGGIAALWDVFVIGLVRRSRRRRS